MSGSSGDYRLGYRADIEGLRAVAILLVVACHAKVSWLAGGFVGVDVFYVLSGYLITGLLVQEIQTTGTLRFANFYARRLRRLLPALLLMLAVACVLGRLLLAADGQDQQALAGTSAALWLSNFHFAFANMDYFAPGAETNLFLHTWSLGVEEQFYLVWPLLVVLGMGAWSGTKRLPTTVRLKFVFGSVFALALALSIYWTWHAPRLAFYMMPSRAWQFALGALVFLGVGTPNYPAGARKPGAAWSTVASWSGLAMIIAAALLINGSVPYPGYWALLPTLGTALVLTAGTGQAGWQEANGWLSRRPMQAVGRVSYSWYLWHWPVLLLGAQLLDARSGWNRLLLVLLSLLIAALSYRFFETPIRHNRRLLAKPRMAVFAGLAIMILAGSLALRWHDSAQARMKAPGQMRFVAAHYDAPVIYSMGCDDWYHSARVRICSFGDPHAKHTAVAIGDSIALQWFPAYAQIFDKPGWQLLVMTKSSCPMVDEPIFYPRIGREYTECSQWRKAALRDIAAIKPDVIVLGSTSNHLKQAQWITGTRRVLAEIAPAARQIYIMRATPRLPFDGPSCLAPRSAFYRMLAGSTRCTAPAYNPYDAKLFQWLQIAAAPYGNVHVVDMTNSVCPAGTCHAEIDGRIVFRDSEHMTGTYAASLAPALAEALSRLDPDTSYAAGKQQENASADRSLP
ncbi:MAG TPA: acyltransferase family protein [Rhodanobacteraceae bacterium]|nr:acyltransferase family protein [Rhodanobacteraceae bacterium]